jgi:hypothetical protein
MFNCWFDNYNWAHGTEVSVETETLRLLKLAMANSLTSLDLELVRANYASGHLESARELSWLYVRPAIYGELLAAC